MINLLPEPKNIIVEDDFSVPFKRLSIDFRDELEAKELLELAILRFWNFEDIYVDDARNKDGFLVNAIPSLDGIKADNQDLFISQGYYLKVMKDQVILKYENTVGYINGITSLKLLLKDESENYKLPLCEIVDYPSVAVRAIAPTFSWYAGYGRIGFDSQLWGYDEWIEFLNISLDNKINQFNMVMYGYWPFNFKEYPETVFRDVPLKIWNAENHRWLTVKYTHPNLEEPFLAEFIEYAHRFGVKIFAYVGLNSYNGAYSIKYPEARSKPPASDKFLNDFDSLCLSYPGTVDYILESMKKITSLGFDGFNLEESEEGFWFCECDDCMAKWHEGGKNPPIEAKHKANLWLLNRIYKEVRKINKDAVIGIRAFRQPPLEKDPEFLRESVESMPDDIMLFWAPGLYVPESEFKKWCDAFGKHRIWARDTEANSITSTMGRLYRTFKSNVIRYEDETNEQVIETDIAQHKGSVEMDVHGINGYVFEWYGLFMHLFAHGNYGWGSRMDEEVFYRRVCELNFGELGEKILYVMQNMVTIHESQIPLYTTPFPFQKNKMTNDDIPAIKAAQENHPKILNIIDNIREWVYKDKKLRHWLPHFDKLKNAHRRNAVIYDLVLAALRYEDEEDPVKKDAILDEILNYNEKDFDIAKEMFFDINPVDQTGVKSCMFPYHELRRLIHNIRYPDKKDEKIICSGIEALGWLWL